LDSSRTNVVTLPKEPKQVLPWLLENKYFATKNVPFKWQIIFKQQWLYLPWLLGQLKYK
jgi:hypothetical protein